jgi:FixJ family two-component response regulator
MHGMNTKNLILYVVDDDEGVRKSLTYLLASRGYQVQLFDSGESFLAKADIMRGGCVILDLRMDGISGLQVFEAIRQRASPLVVLFLSGHGDISIAVEATKNGAFGWLEKPCDETRLLNTVAQALEQAQTVAAKIPMQREAHNRWCNLTPREQQVAHLLRNGKSNKEIARDIHCEVRTVETHRAKVYAKLDQSTPIELDRYLRENKL